MQKILIAILILSLLLISALPKKQEVKGMRIKCKCGYLFDPTKHEDGISLWNGLILENAGSYGSEETLEVTCPKCKKAYQLTLTLNYNL